MESELILILAILFVPSIVICSISWIGTIRYVHKQNRRVLEDIKTLLKKIDE